jgi:hypothetical protein
VQKHGDGTAADPCTCVDRSHVGLQQAGATLCLVHCRNTDLAQSVHGSRVGSIDLSNGNRVHEILLQLKKSQRL